VRPRLLFVGMKYEYGDPKRGIDYGWRNIYASFQTFCARHEWDLLFFDFMAEGLSHGRDGMTQRLRDFVEANRPTFLFACLASDAVDPQYEVFKEISDRGCMTIHWFCDDQWRFENYTAQVAPYFQYSCTTSRQALQKYAAIGLGDRVIRSQWACNTELYRPYGMPKDVPVSFIGWAHGNRPQILSFLLQSGLPLKVFGPGYVDRPRLPFHQMVRMFSRSKINLDLSVTSSMNTLQLKGRTFEVPGTGGFLLTGPCDELGDYYKPGIEVGVYESIDDLVVKARSYLEHEDERELIARRGYERTLAEHTWQHRFEQVFDQVGVIRETGTQFNIPISLEKRTIAGGEPGIIGAWTYYESSNTNNAMFDPSNKAVNRDGCMEPFHTLARDAASKGSRVQSLDTISDFDSVKAFIFFDFPDLAHPLVRKAFNTRAPLVLAAFEPPVVRNENYLPENIRRFDRMLTWNDSLVNGRTICKFNFAQSLSYSISKDPATRTEFAVMIAGAKSSTHPLELYSERVRAIRWFEAYHPDAFKLYGFGWNSGDFPSYRGTIAAKQKTLSSFRFSICYENARDVPGYVTEKIFDCFKAGCIPVYLGAPNITDIIPAECYIDRRQFTGYESLYQYMCSMSDREFVERLEAIEAFLKSDAALPFGNESFSARVLAAIESAIAECECGPVRCRH